MGVPKFFRYISERYPCLSELARDQSIPEFDNLYLDMNGIVHNCSHPDDTNIHFHLEEEQMFKDIFNYIDKLFYLIKPQKLFFLAVDGVAPRAKMNQQRSRRFRSAKEAETLEKVAKLRGEHREHERFDSNCITPGTEFMVRLQEALRYFVKNKLSSDPLWQNCRIILSGHNTPGEGEHKIMDYIRFLKSQQDYDPNTRHCLYGLDADLIILGLCTHELHFVILREEVKFGRKKSCSVEQTRFFLLHLGLLREYLELEFDELRKQDPTFDIAKIIDDWVLMGFLVGNDFVPHLPCLHISSNALPLLYKTYMKVYPQLGGNINENGKLNLSRLEKYFEVLSDVEYEIFQEHYADLQYFNAKLSKNGIEEAFDCDVAEIKKSENIDNDLNELIKKSREFFEEEDDNEEETVAEHMAEEFDNYKRNYYLNKMKKEYTDEVQLEFATSYITALQWILDYYYHGVQSWDWYYPHHYAPFISDLRNIGNLDIKFNMGKPFLPFQQLLGVLPAASQKLLPAAYRDLMTSPNSELISFYPEEFEFDLNGKKHDWESVVLIPFIDEKLLLSAMEKCESKLTTTEIERNRHGPMFDYEYTLTDQGEMPGIYNFKTIYHVYCTEKPIWSKEIAISSDRTMCVELPNAARHVFFPGFPTMRNIKFDFELKNFRVKVFEYASRSLNMVLKPHTREELSDISTVAEKFLNQVVYVGWPHLIKAKVVQILSKEKIIDSDGIRDNDSKIFTNEAKLIEEHLNTRMGIELNDFSTLVNVRITAGSSVEFGQYGDVQVKDAWSTLETAYPAQCIVSELQVQENMKEQFNKIEQIFPINSQIFFIGNPYYGSEGTVLDPMLVYECGRLQVSIVVRPEPDFTEAKYIQSELGRDYVNAFDACSISAINGKCLGRLTGTVLVIPGARRSKPADNVSKLNIGLQFKYPKQQEERSGYARRINNQWFYSSKALELIKNYYELFPEIIHYLSVSSDRYEYCFEEDLYPNNVGEKCIEKICAWVKAQDHMKVESIPCGTKTLEKETVEKLLEVTAELKNLPVKTVKLQVKPHLVLKPNFTLPAVYKATSAIRLFDRVVVVRTTYSVPIGAKGTVISIQPVVDPNPVRLECVQSVEYFYEVLFDRRIANCNDIYGIAEERVYKLPESALLMIMTHDNKKDSTGKVKPFQPLQSWRQGNSTFYNKALIPHMGPGGFSPSNNYSSDLWPQPNHNENSNNCGPSTSANAAFKNINQQGNNSSSNQQQVTNWRSNSNNNSVAVKHIDREQNNELRSKGGSNPPIKQPVAIMPTVTILQKPNDNYSSPLFVKTVPPSTQGQQVNPAAAQQQTMMLKNLLGLGADNIVTAAATERKELPPPPPLFWQREAQQPLPALVIPEPQRPKNDITEASQMFLPNGKPPIRTFIPTSNSVDESIMTDNKVKLLPNSVNAVDPSSILSCSISTLSLENATSTKTINPVGDVMVGQTPSVVVVKNQQPPRASRKKRVPKIGAKFDFA